MQVTELMDQMADIIIVGGGPAGLTAAIYTARMGLKTLVVDGQMIGGRAATAPHVWNFPGFPDGITGVKLIDLMMKQTQKFQAELKYPDEVIELSLEDKMKKVVTRSGQYSSHSVILATGTQRKKLLVPGEEALVGRGVSYCPVCDGPLYRGLDVAVIGSGSEAFEDALHLANLVSKVFAITQSEEITAEQALFDEVKTISNIEIIKGQVLTIQGEDLVTGLTYSLHSDGTDHNLPIDGVFIAVGSVPMTSLMKKAGISVDDKGCVTVNRRQETNLVGVYAAGDCTCGGMQIITAAGEGAMAAMQAHRYIKSHKGKTK
ncbi:MAG: NAD(P)/FAD-dependent oxidoreductase [Candidatus Hermodarchaeota archaeon]